MVNFLVCLVFSHALAHTCSERLRQSEIWGPVYAGADPKKAPERLLKT